jgi:xanthine phosphoribosyltransferase
MIHQTFNEFVTDVQTIAAAIEKDGKPDVILAVARGGFSFAQFLAHALDCRMLFSLNSIHYDDKTKRDTIEIFNVPDMAFAKRILIVDDIIDTGESIVAIKKHIADAYPDANLKVAAIYTKKTALIQPDYAARETDQWVMFLWESMAKSDAN